MSTPTPKIAVIGSGPAGCYLAQSVLRSLPEAQIDMFDRLVSPFGLIRYGVAADHQHTKAITRQFDRLFRSDQVRFAGDVEVGRDVALDELQQCYDAVVLATGLTSDRDLGIPGSDVPGVIGSGQVTQILNSVPGAAETLPALGSDVVVIGAGNVALDVLRFLVKSIDDYDASDIADAALEAYVSDPAQHITLASRSDIARSKGDPQMLKELAALPRAQYTAFAGGTPLHPDTTEASAEPDDTLDRTQRARISAVHELVAAGRVSTAEPEVTLRFGATPLRILGEDRVSAVEFAVGDDVVRVPATSVITAIGFDADGEFARIIGDASSTGRVAPGLYRTGWAKRGPRGAIPENRACAKEVADELVADLAQAQPEAATGRPGFAGLPTQVRERAVSYDQWLTLDAHERALAPERRVRRKLTDHDQMAAVARRASAE